MHETTFVNQILAVLHQNARKVKDAQKVVANVRLSAFSHVTPEALKETFKALNNDESFTKVSLKVLPLELPVECKSCERKSTITQRQFSCPYCQSADINIQMDKEFFVESLDIENE